MSRGFDFFVKAEKVVIKKKSNNKYKVTVNVGDFLKYQVWSSTNSNNINGNRSVSLVNAKDWVEQFKIVNSNNSIRSYKPTTVVEIDNKKYVTVITNAEFKNKKVIFHMSTDDVKFNSKKIKKMNKLPKGEFYNVRFDIDDSGFNSYCYGQCSANGNVFVGTTCNQLCGGVTSCVNSIDSAYSTLSGYPFITNFCSDINNNINNDSPPGQFLTFLNTDLTIDNFDF